MVLLLSSTEVEEALDITEGTEALEKAYRGMATGRAVNRPRSHTFTPTKQPGTYHLFKTIEGGVCELGLYSLRINSELWHLSNAGRTVKVPAASGSRYVEFILYFSLEDGQLVAILPDGILQKTRVAMTHALAAKHLLGKPARCMGLFGSGWQASAQAEVQASVHGLERIDVFSPNRDHRHSFAARMSERLNLEVRPVDRPEDVVRDADFVVAATNSPKPIFTKDMLKPGLHFSSIKSASEISPDFVQLCHRRYVHNKLEPLYFFCNDETPPELTPGRQWQMDTSDWPSLAEVIAGQAPGRESPEEITLMLDGDVGGAGLGTQFTAVGACVIARARELGLGKELPLDWFLDVEEHSH